MKAFVHPNGICESRNVGEGTRIWAFAHVLSGATIGADCNICDHVFIENDVMLGDRVTVKCGVQLWDGLRVGNDVFLGPNVTLTNDPFPRSKQYPKAVTQTVIEEGASIGANSTLLPGIRIGRQAMVGAGSVVTRDVPPGAIVMGNPAHNGLRRGKDAASGGPRKLGSLAARCSRSRSGSGSGRAVRAPHLSRLARFADRRRVRRRSALSATALFCRIRRAE